jgi:large subunit ribosomal protein L30
MYAVVRLRGNVNTKPDSRTTLQFLNLKRINNASVWQESNQILRMIKNVDAFIAFGKINDAVLEKLVATSTHVDGKKVDAKKAVAELKAGKTMNELGLSNCFRLKSPVGGHERGGIKRAYKVGGASGNRGEKINELLEQMM